MTFRREDLAEGVTLYCGDCRDVLPTLGWFDLILADPPYGIDYVPYQPDARPHEKIVGDTEKFDPSFLIGCPCILWGANNYPEKLPRGGWLCWDKRISEAADRMLGSPFELAWCSKSNLYKIARILHGGVVNADGAGIERVHPTQKPVALMIWCLRLFPDAKVTCDPFMGSGTTGVAAVKEGRQFVGIEIEPRYFDIACRRISDALARPDLFITAPKPIDKQEALL